MSRLRAISRYQIPSFVLASAGILGCHHDPAPASRPATLPPVAAPTNGVVGEYAAAYDGKGVLRVEATLSGVRTSSFEVEEGADAYLADIEAAPLGTETWTKPTRDRHMFVLAPCASGSCRLRYTAKIREAGKGLDELEVASVEGDVIIAPPSSWLLTPPRDDDATKIRFRVTTPPGITFATGVYRSKTAPDAWEITLSDLWTAPYSAFGPLRMHAMDGFQIAFGPGKLALTEDQIAAWANRCASAVKSYYAGFPMKDWLLIMIAGKGRMVGEGKTLSGGGGAIFMRVGDTATDRSLERDWVLTHEMTHLTFPTLSRNHHWAEEGMATYVEPFARTRIGWLTAADAWKGVVEGVPQGQPESGDRGLDQTHTWGRTYWGGALFFLVADVGIRKQSGNKFGLEHAFRAINAKGGNNSVRWSIEDTFAIGDAAVGGTVLSEQYRKWSTSAVTVDLDAMWRDLGVVYKDGKVTFDDTAPNAAIRKAITTAD